MAEEQLRICKKMLAKAHKAHEKEFKKELYAERRDVKNQLTAIENEVGEEGDIEHPLISETVKLYVPSHKLI